MDNGRDLTLESLQRIFFDRLLRPARLTHPLKQRFRFAGLRHKKRNILCHCLCHDLIAVKGRNQNRFRAIRQGFDPIQQTKAVQYGQQNVRDEQLRLLLRYQLQGAQSVSNGSHHIELTRFFYRLL